MKEKENISLLKNSEDNSMNEVLFYPSLQFTDDSIDAEANNVLQIVETNEMIPTDPLQIDLNEDTMIENEASNANVYATEATQSVLLSTINDNDCLDVPSDIPDVFKKTLFWPRTNNSAAKKRAVKVKVPSVATSVAWQEYHRAKETEKSQRLIAVEERKRKRQEMAEKKKTRSRGKEKAKNVATSRKSYQKK
ncbi:PREDICTED: uncharacterized protein LOC108781930 [Cyphomyrmex costatus]|uniref:uncharacterized protein LOC108781930 n=1 Tax=Cyphomyrmex costatus TaxID=456900 RepID=UPI000852346F|nr:PREDICTED: uncharacterized protein LOC108781930 [Cyphomyrmex costatus]